MISQQNRRLSHRVLLLYLVGVYLFAVVFLSPHAGYWEGRLFFKVAQASTWDRWWDWAAAWCSMKIILLSIGVFSIIAAFGMLLKILHQESLARAILFLNAVPALGFWLGVFYLVKALL